MSYIPDPFGKITISQNDLTAKNVNETLGYIKLDIYQAADNATLKADLQKIIDFATSYSYALTTNQQTTAKVTYEVNLHEIELDN